MGEATAELKALTVLNPTAYMPVSGTGSITRATLWYLPCTLIE